MYRRDYRPAYLARKGDGICIDWGYAYLAGNIGANTAVSLGNYYGMKNEFATKGSLLPTQAECVTRRADQMPAMAYTDDLGEVGTDGKSGFLMLGYDDIYAIDTSINLAWPTGSMMVR